MKHVLDSLTGRQKQITPITSDIVKSLGATQTS